MSQKDIIFIISSIFFVIIVWIAFEIYHNSVTSTISERLNTQVIPIKADFDSKTIENIKKREKVEPLYKTSTSSALPSPTITPTESASPTPTITPSEGEGEATPEGELLP